MCRAHIPSSRPPMGEGKDMCRYSGKPETATTTIAARAGTRGVTASKESSNILFAGTRWGVTKKGPKNAMAEWVFVDEKRIPLGRIQPDGVHTQVGHVTGPKGPRSTLTYYDYCERAECSFTVSSLEDRVERAQWERILIAGEKLGLGALRSLSHGQFVVTAFDRL